MCVCCKEPDTDARTTSSMAEDAAAAVVDTEPAECSAEELVLRVVRDMGVGLGLSITGGLGTSAFTDDDEVTLD